MYCYMKSFKRFTWIVCLGTLAFIALFTGTDVTTMLFHKQKDSMTTVDLNTIENYNIARKAGEERNSALRYSTDQLHGQDRQSANPDVDKFAANVTLAPLCSTAERVAAIKNICDKLGLTEKPSPRTPNFIIDPEHEIAYCEISKVGSTNMKRVLATSTKKGRELPKDFKTDWHNGNFLRKMGLQRKSASDEAIANYTKVFIVRNPFDRLISAYNSKLGPLSPGNGGYAGLSQRIMRFSNRDKNETELGERERATFPEFIHALALGGTSRRNNHWIPYAQFCDPCHIDYDVILRIESMSYDSIPVMRKLNMSENHVEQKNYSQNKRLRYKEPAVIKGERAHAVLKTLDPFQQVPPSEIEILKTIYYMDFKLYGYTFNESTLAPNCVLDGTNCC